MKRYLVQYKAVCGGWFDAFDLDQSVALFDAYDEARSFQDWAESGSHSEVRVVTLEAPGINDTD